MFVASTRLDQTIVDAALLMGTPQRAVILRVILPQLVPAVLTSFTLAFCLAYGSFITPAALGGINDVTITRLIGSLLADGRAADASAAALVALLGPAAFVALYRIALTVGRITPVFARDVGVKR